MPYFLSPIGNSQIVDANGDPLVGGTIETYLAGTSTAATTYTDDTGGTPHGSTINLNSLGRPTLGPVWMLGGVPLKFIVKNALGVVQPPTFDDISGIGDTSVTPDQFPFIAPTPTYISATSFSFAGDQTNDAQINRRIRSINTGGTIYSTISNAAFGAGITTVTVVNDSGVLDSDLSQVNYGLLTPTNSALPPASSTTTGGVELATTAEMQTGTDAARVPSVDSMRNGLIVLGTKQAANVAVAVFDFTGIPAYAKRVFVHYYLYSTNGTSPPLIQIGDAGGFETAGYVGSGFDGSGGAAAVYTTGFGLGTGNNAAAVMSGTITLTRIDSATHTWSASGGVGRSDAGQTFSTLGAKTLTAALDRVRATTVGGVNTADGVADSFINVSWE